ncbi:Gfo/Idh/MocA family protein [Pedococcus sp. 5OH_020]|uniref:Gfo/Idh/MocA family protein n=1 Tax=Pedococcus sp. 5OH_020 TaxID=2989814 RepID=UPI0022E9A161|nr:Gfo/Idh/MocA family oxidoreductase [Pedococcus sp. 5OH_020]
MSRSPRRAAVVGLGSRATMWAEGLADGGRLVAFCDENRHRMRVQEQWLRESHPGLELTCWQPHELLDMIVREQVDTVVVCTPDHTHEAFVVQAVEAGCDVIVEKPLTITEDACRSIVEAQRRTGRSIRVAFNYRYNPVHEQVRDLIADGAIGEVGSVHFEWALDLHHGADYFRRWHRDKASSGGLLVHKSSHHFDLVSWWLGASPERVFAEGRLFYYGAAGAERGLDHGDLRERRDAGLKPFDLDLSASDRLRALYLEAEGEQGYRRDRNVFGPGITIEDDMAVLVRYDTGATMTYHLTAYSPWEGYRVTFNGSQGRLELEVEESAWAAPQAGAMAGTIAGAEPPTPRARLVHRPMWREPVEVAARPGVGAHGGGDARMMAELLQATDEADGRSATFVDGVRAAMTGIAANHSIATQLPVPVGAVLRELTGSATHTRGNPTPGPELVHARGGKERP